MKASTHILRIGIHCEPIATEELFVAVAPTHPLTSHKEIHLNDVNNLPFVSASNESELGDITKDIFQISDFDPSIVFEGQTPDIICDLVKSGVGFCFLPASWQNNYNANSLAKLHVTDYTCERTIWLSWLNERQLSETLLTLKSLIIEAFHNTCYK